MNDDDSNNRDHKAGYCKSPKAHRFRKGKSGNPAGRPKKKRPTPRDNSEAALLASIDGETVTVNEIEMTRREHELRVLQAKAAQGNLAAISILARKRRDLKIDTPVQRGGVLRVPAPLSPWKRQAGAQQAKYREHSYAGSSSPVDEDKDKS